jgi:hypothetical protein
MAKHAVLAVNHAVEGIIMAVQQWWALQQDQDQDVGVLEVWHEQREEREEEQAAKEARE